ncbi:MAG: SDR family NAD(P)-dependent oxidoreductase [Deltaproteobacteria bacterium]|nr:SDR family NAD(P)-dependent oxidoreductase [Nannocystaceae bacterium]
MTGANSGLGFETTKSLALRGYRIILAVRDRARGEDARDAIRTNNPSADLEVRVLDLAELDAVRDFAAEIEAVDVLVNNAGIGAMPLQRTREGVTTQFGVNHLGHFLLTALLWPRLSASVSPRVVTVGSGFGRKGRLDLDNLDASRGYGQGRAYMQSKLANSLFAAELDRRARSSGARPISVLAHPGVAATAMPRKPTGLVGVAARIVSVLFARSQESGALPLVEAATSLAVHGGEIFGPGRGRAGPLQEPRWPSFDDLGGAAALWARSEELTRTPFLREAGAVGPPPK